MQHRNGTGKNVAARTEKIAAPPEQETNPLTTCPQTPDELHDWLIRKLDVRVGRTPLLEGHAAPFDYLCHAFFEGEMPRPSAPASPPERRADVVVWANRGGGKTFLGALATLLDLLFKPGIQVRILGGSLDQSLRMRAHLAALLAHPSLESVEKKIAARRIELVPPGSGKLSVVEVLAASQTSVRGTRVQKLRCDEVDLFHPEVWEAAQLVTRSMPLRGPWGDTVRGSVEALSTMHEPFGLMWNLVGPSKKQAAPTTPQASMRPVLRWGVLDVLEHCTDEHVCDRCLLLPECAGKAKTAINPGAGGHLSVSDAISQKARVSQSTWEAEMLCLRPSRASAVYPEFDAATHVVRETSPERFERYIGGMDFGYRSEAALLLAGVDHDGAITVLREYVRAGAYIEEFADQIDRWVTQGVCTKDQIDFIGVDPAGNAQSMSGTTTCVQFLRQRGLHIRSCQSRIAPGVQQVRRLIAPAGGGQPGLLVHESCTRLIECLTRYSYDPRKPESDEPEKKGHDHAPDALRYMVINMARGKMECANYTQGHG